MQCKIKNNANYDLSSMEHHIHGMYDHFHEKYGFQKPPVMVFDTEPSNESNVLGKTAYYDPQAFEIHVFVDGRHPKDMLRSIAHELIHHKQNLDGRLDVGGYNGPGYYLENDKLREVEQEAMLEGNATLREYEDKLKLEEKEKMSLKEWKNNEINQLLLKKFGILKEEKEIETDEEVSEEESLKEISSASEQVADRKRVGSQSQSDRLHEDELEEGGAASRTGNENHDESRERMVDDRKHENLKRTISKTLKENKKIRLTIKK